MIRTITADPVPIGTGTLSVADRYGVRSSACRSLGALLFGVDLVDLDRLRKRSESTSDGGEVRVNLGVGMGWG